MSTGLPELTWAVTDEKGAPVTTLAGLAEVLGVQVKDAATSLLESAYVSAAPAGLVEEAKAAAASPPIANGSFVQLGNIRGRVDLVVTNGSVPGVPDDAKAEGSAKSPAARVVVYERAGDSWKATSRKIGASVYKLKKIAPLPGARALAKKSVQGALADLRDETEALADVRENAVVPEMATLLTVYERGVKAWPGRELTDLTPQEWALGRARAFCTKALGDTDDVAGYTRDDDLLAAHPAEPGQEQPPDDAEVEQRQTTEQAGTGADTEGGGQTAAEGGGDPAGVAAPGVDVPDPVTDTGDAGAGAQRQLPDNTAAQPDAHTQAQAGDTGAGTEDKGLHITPADLAATLGRFDQTG
jgi:hypothetical protein